MVLAAVPLYVCSTSSVPVVAALIAKGVSPGTAFVFFLAGPATNAATVATVAKVLGGRAVAAYLVAVSTVAIGAGVLMDIFFLNAFADLAISGHQHEDGAWLWQVAAVALAAVLLWPSVKKLLKAKSAAGDSCCAGEKESCCTGESAEPQSTCCASEAAVPKTQSSCSAKPAAAESGCCSGKSDTPAAQACCGGKSKTAAEKSCCGGTDTHKVASSCCDH